MQIQPDVAGNCERLAALQGEIDQLESSVDPTATVANRLTELVCECAEGPAKTPAPIFNALDNSVSIRTMFGSKLCLLEHRRLQPAIHSCLQCAVLPSDDITSGCVWHTIPRGIEL